VYRLCLELEGDTPSTHRLADGLDVLQHNGWPHSELSADPGAGRGGFARQCGRAGCAGVAEECRIAEFAEVFDADCAAACI